MKNQDWLRTIAGSARARIVSVFLFLLLIGGFAVWAFRANAGLAAARASQTGLAQQTQDIRAASSLNDLYNQGWLANDRNFTELAGYVRQLVHFSASPSLDPKFKQELSDYILKNKSRLPKEAQQIEGLSFSEGILRQDQSRLLDMYDQLSLVFHTMEDMVSGWDVDTPQRRGERMIIIQEAFSTAGVEFQATTASHREILKYAKQLDEQSKQASATGLDRIQSYRTQRVLSMAGLIVSLLLFAVWEILLKREARGESRE